MPAPPPQAAARAAPTLNPNISLVGDFRAWYASEGERNVDAELHEAEAALRSVVDPYARADVFIAMGHGGDGEFEFELEEAYLTTLALPFQLQLKAGKFRSIFGKINRIHPHALPFIDTPAVYANFFGDEGLNDQGLSLSWLLPNPHFFQDLTVEVTRGPGGGEGSFGLSERNRLLYVALLGLDRERHVRARLQRRRRPQRRGPDHVARRPRPDLQVEAASVQHLPFPHASGGGLLQPEGARRARSRRYVGLLCAGELAARKTVAGGGAV